MSFRDAEITEMAATLDAFLRRERPPAHIRAQLDYAYVIRGRSIELHEIRPRWDDATQQMVRPFAKATYLKSREVWRVYWLPADLKWHFYKPTPMVATLEEFLALVSEDTHACFHG
jgi:hypothetical protein